MGMQEVLCLTGILAVVATVAGLFLSFDSLEYQVYGLNYSWISEQIEKTPYTSGRHFLGPGNHFIKFPRMVKSIFFISDYKSSGRAQNSYVGPSLQGRTRDGLNIQIEASFQYRLRLLDLYDMYATLGENYEHQLVRLAIETLTVATTKHDANFFFTNRSVISNEMTEQLAEQFKTHAFSEVPFFQLRGVQLPKPFEDAIQESQDKQQDITIAELEQKSNRVTFETEVLKAEQAVKVKMHQAEGEVASIKAQNDAFCTQYEFTQTLQAEALQQMKTSSGWDNQQLIDYLKVRVVREHPSEKTTINL